MNLHKAGGASAYLMAASYLVGIALNTTILDTSRFVDPMAKTTFIVNHQIAFTSLILALYVGFGICLVFLALAVHGVLATRSSALSQAGTAFGLGWAVLLIGSGLVYKTGVTAVASLYAAEPVAAARLMGLVEVVHEGLGCTTEVPGGLWILLVSLAGWRASVFPRPLNRMGVSIGAAGLLTIFSPLYLPAVGAFALGSIVWFFWLGTILFRSSSLAQASTLSVN